MILHAYVDVLCVCIVNHGHGDFTTFKLGKITNLGEGKIEFKTQWIKVGLFSLFNGKLTFTGYLKPSLEKSSSDNI